jgi:hypothetical protein
LNFLHNLHNLFVIVAKCLKTKTPFQASFQENFYSVVEVLTTLSNWPKTVANIPSKNGRFWYSFIQTCTFVWISQTKILSSLIFSIEKKPLWNFVWLVHAKVQVWVKNQCYQTEFLRNLHAANPTVFGQYRIGNQLKPRTNIVDRHKKSDVLTENLLFYCQNVRFFVSADNICTRLK